MKGSRTGKFIKIIVIAAVIAICLIAYISFATRDRVFRGKPESQWIAELKYNDAEQVKQWKEFGPGGVHVLVRGLEQANAESDRIWRNSRWAPRLMNICPPLARFFPVPKVDSTYERQTSIVDLLSRLGKDAMDAVPVMMRAAASRYSAIRLSAICFFTSGEDDNAPLRLMSRRDKRELLNTLIDAMHDSDWGMRNNAAIALGYYADEKEKVAPILVKALADNKPEVQLLAAGSLLKVAPDQLLPSGAIPTVIALANNPDDQIAYRALELLGDMQKEPVKVLPVLCEAAMCTNLLLSDTAIHALTQFPEHSAITLPVLEKIAEHNSQTSGHAKDAVKKIKSMASAKTN